MLQFLQSLIGQYPLPVSITAIVLILLGWTALKIKKAVTTMWPFVQKLVRVVDDLFGTEAREGVDARPGLMERMASSEAADRKTAETLAQHTEALKELQPNHGGSMKDVLNKINTRIETLEKNFAEHIASQRGPEQIVNVLNVTTQEGTSEPNSG